MGILGRKLTLALLATSLFGVVLVAVFTRWMTQREFDRLTLEEARVEFVDRAQMYYQQHGSWQGVESVFPLYESGQEPPPPPFALADEGGRILIGAGQLRVGQHAPQDLLDKAIPIEVRGHMVGRVITVNLPPPRTVADDQFLARVDQAVLVAAIGTILVGLGISVVLARTLTRPIHELTSAARHIAAGDLQQEVDVHTRDELGELASAFNRMSADLDRASTLRRQMTSDIAHELRTPLTVIHGHLEGLRDGVLKPSAERIDVLYAEVENLMRLVEDLRTLSLADAGALPLYRHPTDPIDLLKRAVAAFTPQAQEQGISIELLTESLSREVNVDPQRLEQVLGNLLSNSLSNTPPGGRIQLSANAKATSVVLKVQDNGVGIPAEELSRVFDRFHRVKTSQGQEGRGTGLGLSIAKSIIEAHGGTIEVESTLGEGTTIQITLPA